MSNPLSSKWYADGKLRTPTYPMSGEDVVVAVQESAALRLVDDINATFGDWLGHLTGDDRAEAKAAIFKKLYGGPTDMKDYEALERQAQRLLKYAEEARIEAERWGDDDFPDGAVITFTKMFPGGSIPYNYAAIKTFHQSTGISLWYTTGPKSPKGYTWEELTIWMGSGVTEVFYVTALEKFVG